MFTPESLDIVDSRRDGDVGDEEKKPQLWRCCGCCWLWWWFLRYCAASKSIPAPDRSKISESMRGA